MAERFCKVCRGWHDLDQPWPHNCLPEVPQRSDLPAPMVITDTMAPVQSMATGKMYDSKAGIRAEYKALGMVEVGNDPQRFARKEKPKIDRQAIKDTVLKAAARVERGERAKKSA